MKKQVISLLARKSSNNLYGASASNLSCCFSSTRSMNGRPRKNPITETTNEEVKKSKTSITSEDSAIVVDRTISLEKQNEILIQSMDKLSKRYEKMEKALAAQQELLGMMSTTLHVIGEQQVQNRVLQLLRLYKIIPAQNSANAPSPFIRVNTRDKLESLVTSFVNPQHLPTAIQSIKKSIPHQLFVSGIDGSLQSYLDITNPNWVHHQSGGSMQKLVSGDVCMVGTLENITFAIHRALRYPVVVRRFTSRVNNLLFQHADPNLSITQGMEKTTLFVVVGTPKSFFEETLPINFFNRILTEKDFDDLEQYILDSFDGTVVIPDDSELQGLILDSDPVKDPLGIWKLLLSVEYNGHRILSKKRLEELRDIDSDISVKILLLSLIKLIRIHNFDLFLGSVVNPLN